MPVGIPEIDTASTAAAVRLHVLQRTGPAAVGDALGLNPAEDLVEVPVTHVECIVVPFELVPVVEVEREGCRSPAPARSARSARHS